MLLTGTDNHSAGPLDRFKMTVGEGGIRTPLLVAGPGISAGTQVDAFAYVTDLMPTMLEMAGLEHPASSPGRSVEPMRGRSLRGVLSGATRWVYAADEVVGGEMQGGMWLRQGDYKAVSIASPYGSGQWQLFNVVHDPGETRDLGDERPEFLAELRGAWDRYARDVGVVIGED